MSYKEILRSLSKYLFLFSFLFLVPLLIAIYYEFFIPKDLHPQPHATLAFFLSFLITFAAACLCLLLSRGSKGTLIRRESIVVVISVWILSSLFAAFPFYLSGTLQHPLDALFESVSGLTTTGSTILHPKAYFGNVEVPITLFGKSFYGTVKPVLDETGTLIHEGIHAISKALLFWRAFLQWIGGMGIIVLFVSVLPALSMGGRLLFEAEITGPSKEGLAPRVKQTASILWKIYLGMTVIEIILLKLTNASLSLFDSATLALSSISTGGFTSSANLFTAYQSGITEWILILFMIIGSINFGLYFYCFKGKIYKLFEPEFIFFISSLFCGSLLMSLILWLSPSSASATSTFIPSFKEALNTGTFQAISAQTSTGLINHNYDLWPYAAQGLIIILTFIGGMSGSTSGGMKIGRVYILYKVILSKIKTLFRPETVTCIKIGTKQIAEPVSHNVLIYICVLILTLVISTFIFLLDGLDPFSSFGLSSSMLNNSGLSFGILGPSNSLAFLSPISKILSILLMFLGRLEFFVMLVLFVPSFWRNR